VSYDRRVTWRALLDGDDRARALARVEAIADELDRRELDDPSLAFGLAGVALLHGYRARAGRDDGADRAFAAIERALAAFGTLAEPWLFEGAAGLGFAIHHLADQIGDAGDVLVQLDDVASAALALSPPLAWDLTHGCIGLGVYGLERGLPAITKSAVDHVVAIARREDGGAAWWSDAPAPSSAFVNLGLAHGVAGAIAFLAEAAAAGDGRAGTAELAREAVRWLRRRERDGRCPRYPMSDPDRAPASGRMLDGWCYGDPSTAAVLVRAGNALDEPTWIEAGRALARHAARRTAQDLAELELGSSLCHGAIGHAHVLNRLWQATRDDDLRGAACRWADRALADKPPDDAPPGLQLGLAGIALALLAASSEVEPTWDRALLLSLPIAA
jgi:hypothetical protein